MDSQCESQTLRVLQQCRMNLKAVLLDEITRSLLELVDRHRDPSAFDRAVTLSWTQSQVQLRHHGVSKAAAVDFQRLAGMVIRHDARLRAPAAKILAGAGAQSRLWGMGISAAENHLRNARNLCRQTEPLHLPEPEVITGIGPVPVNVPRERDRGAGDDQITFPLIARRLWNTLNARVRRRFVKSPAIQRAGGQGRQRKRHPGGCPALDLTGKLTRPT